MISDIPEPIIISSVIALLFAITALVLFLELRSQRSRFKSEGLRLRTLLEEAADEIATDHAQRQREKEKFTELFEDKNMLERDYAILHTRFEESTRSSNEKIKMLDEARESLKKQFESLAHEIFEKRSRDFDEQQQKNLGRLLQPFREQISHFSKQTEDRFVKEASDRAVLHKEISLLKTLNERIGEDALNLTKALKGENKTQGNWGEIILERILEQSGLREGSEYETQGSYRDAAGKMYRPDVIVHLPEGKDIVIDSKVSLAAYETFMSTDDPEEKAHALKSHLNSIHMHIKGLSKKGYESLKGIRTLDFVLLFMPIEGAFLLALEQDNTFFKRAYEHNIMVVGPSTLLVTLRTIEHIWRTERQEQNAQEIVRQAEGLLDKFSAFSEDMNKIGQNIERTQMAYEDAMNKLTTGKGNLVRRTEKMKQLGLRPKKMMPLRSEEEHV